MIPTTAKRGVSRAGLEFIDENGGGPGAVAEIANVRSKLVNAVRSRTKRPRLAGRYG